MTVLSEDTRELTNQKEYGLKFGEVLLTKREIDEYRRLKNSENNTRQVPLQPRPRWKVSAPQMLALGKAPGLGHRPRSPLPLLVRKRRL